MGYYSNVRIIVKKEDFKILYNYVEKYLKENCTEDFDNLLNEEIIKYMDGFKEEKSLNGTDFYYIGYPYVKWYEEYDEVKSIMNGLIYLDEHNKPFRFCRIGENYDDIEEIYSHEAYEDDVLPYPQIIKIIKTFDDDNLI